MHTLNELGDTHYGRFVSVSLFFNQPPTFKGGNMKELLLKVFNNRKYWILKMTELCNEEREARRAWREAVRLHEKSKDKRFKYELAALRVNKAYPKYLKAMGRV